MQYGDEDATWKDSDIREYLNKEEYNQYYSSCFLRDTFTRNEESAIIPTLVEYNNREEGWEDENTIDKVYILNKYDISNPAYGFSEDYNKVDATRMAGIAQTAVRTHRNWIREYIGKKDWYLRSTGSASTERDYVEYDGYINGDGEYWTYSTGGIRPVLHLDISQNVWSYAGETTVYTSGEKYITFDYREGNREVTEKNVSVGCLYEDLPVAEREGYIFDGWYTEPTGGNQIVYETIVEDNIPQILYAHWTKVNQPELKNPVRDDEKVTYDCVYFGHYYQDDTNGDNVADYSDNKTHIKWRVLKDDGDDLFLMADRGLYTMDFWCWDDHEEDEECELTWEDSNIRNDYLNDTLRYEAFTDAEWDDIKETDVDNSGNAAYGTIEGPATKDKLYLLSCEEISNPEYGFDSNLNAQDAARISYCTLFAKNSNFEYHYYDYTSTYGEDGDIHNYSHSSLLRTIVNDTYEGNLIAAIVTYNGYMTAYDDGTSRTDVCPVMHIKKSSTNWTYAGTEVINTTNTNNDWHKITFDANGGLSWFISKHVYKSQEYKFFNNGWFIPVRYGYRFTGWYTSKDGGTKLKNGDIVDEDITVYAHWVEDKRVKKEDAPQTPAEDVVYTVTFDPTDGKTAVSNKKVTLGKAYGELPVPEKDFYVFLGWFTEKEAGTEIKAEDIVTLTGNVTLYARWEKVKSNSIGKQKQDISSIVDTSSLEEDEKIAGYYIKDKNEKKLASVNKKGVITPKKSGTVHITAYKLVRNEKNKKVKVDVDTVEVKIVVPKFTVKNLTIKSLEKLDATEKLEGYKDACVGQDSVTWKSSKPAVATIDPDTGLITPVKNGKTKITVEFVLSGKKVSYSFNLKIKVPK